MKKRKIVLLIMTILSIYICLRVGISLDIQYVQNNNYETQANDSRPVGEITEGMVICQELPKIKRIRTIDILFANYGKTITSDIRVKIVSSKQRELYSTTINGSNIKDNEYYTMPVNINVSNKELPLSLIVEGANGETGNAVTIWNSAINNEESGYYINGEKTDRSLRIRLNIGSDQKVDKVILRLNQALIIIMGAILFIWVEEDRSIKKILTKIYKYRYITMAAIFFLSVFVFKVNFSSYRAYEGFLPNNFSAVKDTTLNEYRGIRSDEWGVLTPIQLSQEANNYEEISTLLGEEVNLSVVSGAIPVKDISIIGKPFSWGFILFGNDIGFSWYHMSKLLLILCFSYKLVYILTKNKGIAFAGAIVLGFSPGINWWLTTNTQATEVIIYLEMIIVALYYMFTQGSKIRLILYSILLMISTIGFTLVLYPPVQIPLVYLGIALLIGLYLDNREVVSINKTNMSVLTSIIIIYIFIMGITLKQILPDMQKILSTVYPGKRFITGGNLSLEYFFNYIPTMLLPYKSITYSNASEISSFITFFPIPFVIYANNREQLKSCKVLNSIKIFILASIVFMIIGIPNFMAKITLMSMVTEERLFLVFGLATTLFMLILLAKLKDKKTEGSKYGEYIIFTVIAYYLYKNYPHIIDYMGTWVFVLLILLCLGFIYLIKNQKSIFLKLLVYLTVVCGMVINPINFGISAMQETPLAEKIREINSEESGRWITLDDLWISKYVLAQGVETLNALNYPPKLELWSKLDPNNQYEDIYNRYAHVQISLSDSEEKGFELIQPDVFKVHIDMDEIKELGVKYILCKNVIESSSDVTIELKYYDELDGINIYKVK